MTAVEVLVGASITIWVLGTLVFCTYLLDNSREQYSAQVDLTTKARRVVEEMVWGQKQVGIANRRGIAEAVSATISATQIDYMDINNVQHSLRSNNGNIEYRRTAGGNWVTLLDPNGQAAYDATQYLTNLNFSQTVPNVVDIKLVLGKKFRGRWSYGSISTQVAFRNAS